jgi:hypothetical protein
MARGADGKLRLERPDLEERVAELERQVLHADLPLDVAGWLAHIAKNGAITGQQSLAYGRPTGPILQWTIFPDGKVWLQICDMNLCPIWNIRLAAAGKVPDAS